VLRVEVMQLLEESFKILDSDDVKRLFGADNAGRRGRSPDPLLQRAPGDFAASAHGRYRREVLRLAGTAAIPADTRSQFETLLLEIRGAIGRVAHQRAGHGSGQTHRSHRVLPWTDATDANQSQRAAQSGSFSATSAGPESNWNTKSDLDVTPRPTNF